MIHILEKLTRARQELEFILSSGTYRVSQFEKLIFESEIKELMKLKEKIEKDNFSQLV